MGDLSVDDIYAKLLRFATDWGVNVGSAEAQNALDLEQWKRIEALRQAKSILQTAGTGKVDAFDIQQMAEYILSGEKES